MFCILQRERPESATKFTRVRETVPLYSHIDIHPDPYFHECTCSLFFREISDKSKIPHVRLTDPELSPSFPEVVARAYLPLRTAPPGPSARPPARPPTLRPRPHRPPHA